jgi:hypothetical protein
MLDLKKPSIARFFYSLDNRLSVVRDKRQQVRLS